MSINPYISMAIFMILALVFYIYNIEKRVALSKIQWNPISKQILGVLFLIIGLVIFSVNPPYLFLRTFGIFCIWLSILLAIVAHKELFDEVDQPIRKSKLFHLIIVSCGIISLLDFARGDNIGYYITNQPFIPDIAYFAYMTFGMTIIVFLESILARNSWKYFKRPGDATYKIRQCTVFIAHFLVITSIIAVLIHLYTYILEGGPIHFLMTIYRILVPLSGLFLALYILPQHLLRYISHPIEKRNERLLSEALQYLYPKYTAITPSVILYQQYRPSLRQMQEAIGRSRYIILSHEPLLKPIIPEKEARILLKRLQSHCTIEHIGPAEPVPLFYTTRKHTIRLATHLRALENQQAPGKE